MALQEITHIPSPQIAVWFMIDASVDDSGAAGAQSSVSQKSSALWHKASHQGMDGL
jgi:hypothetical protein